MTNTDIERTLDALVFHHDEGLYFLRESILNSEVDESEELDAFCDECDDFQADIMTGR